MAKTYRTTLQVRGYELDSFGHVNHAVYVQYFEHARWEMLNAEGITLEKFKEWDRWPVIAGLEVQYLRPTYLHDSLDIETQITEFGHTHFHVSQEIRRGDTVVARGKIRAVMVNAKGRPSAMPESVKVLWENTLEGGGD